MQKIHGLLKYLRSMKFAVLLIILLALVSLPSTLIIQKENPEFYADRYGDTFTPIILFFGMDNVFLSIPFLGISGLFFLNLGYCSIWRFIREFKKKKNKRHGPDILHLGLLVFLFGAFFSAVLTDESPIVWMEKGDAITLPRGGRFRLTKFESSFYPDGRPQDWVSHGLYIKGRGEEKNIAISVNSPARIEGIKIYQYSVRPVYTLNLIPRPGSGAPEILQEGGDYAGMTFVSVRYGADDQWEAVFLDASGEVTNFRQGDKIAEAYVTGFDSQEITGLRLASDKGVYLVFLSFFPITLGFFMIVFEKRKTL